MTDVRKELPGLLEKLSGLENKQESLNEEIKNLRQQINDISAPLTPAAGTVEDITEKESIPHVNRITDDPFTTLKPEKKKQPLFRRNLEEFIGKNLINKIGIIITVIGAGTGVKYAIDHELIGFWTRIVLGYILAAGLLGFALKLRRDYLNFSAVLFSGSMAIFYFMTYAAFSFYSLIPMTIAFFLMLLFTIVTVAAALMYYREVIAVIGLVGAYAIPFLISSDSSRVAVLFTYITIINAGILVIALSKYWKYLYYAAFVFTWAIFISWYVTKFDLAQHFPLTWTFLSIFFVCFYITFLSYKLIRKKEFKADDIVLLLLNSSFFYGFGMLLLNDHLIGSDYMGWFTLGNSLIHFGVSFLISRVKNPDRNLLSFITGLAVAFLTIAVPVQLSRNWVSMLWSVEAAILFHIGRTRNNVAYEILSYPLAVIAFFSLVSAWPAQYHTAGDWPPDVSILPLINVNFLTSIVFILSFTWIFRLIRQKKHSGNISGFSLLIRTISIVVPGMLLVVSYFSLYIEIVTFWNQAGIVSKSSLTGIPGLLKNFESGNVSDLTTLSLIAYSFLFFTGLSAVNIRNWKNPLLGMFNLGFNLVSTGIFLTLGLMALGDLRETYIISNQATNYYHGIIYILARYIMFALFAFLIRSVYRYSRQDFTGFDFKMEFDLFLHICLLTIACNELINWMDLAGSKESFKLGLSILCGIYSLILIILGIWKKKLHLRISAIVLFSLTLIKLFFYDLNHLSTIAKTVVFLILGILLLIISFLYNKYRKVLFEEKQGK